MCALLDTKDVGNFHHLRAKAFDHEMLRIGDIRQYPSTYKGNFLPKFGTLYPARQILIFSRSSANFAQISISTEAKSNRLSSI